MTHPAYTLLFFVVVWYWLVLPISVTSQTVTGQSYDWPSASEETLKNVEIDHMNHKEQGADSI